MRLRAIVPLALILILPAALPAQVHPGGQWWTLETAHFRVHVRPALRALGEQAAAEAEAAYASLAKHLEPPTTRIDLIVSDDADFSNGFTTTYPSLRVGIFLVPPAGDVELDVFDRWLRLVLTHELTHAFHLDVAHGWWRIARSVFGRAPGLFPNEYAPDWLTEGLAVHYESRLTGGGRESGSYHGAIVGAASAEGRGMPLDAAGGISPRWPAGLRPYAFGGSFFGHVARELGDSAIPRLVRETARRPIPYLGLNGAMGAAGGRSLTQEWRAWQDSLKRGDGRAEGSAGAPTDERQSASARQRAAVRGLRALVPPRVSRDGRRILFVSNDGRHAVRVAVLDRGTGRIELLSRANAPTALAWDTGGAALVSELEFADPYTIRSDLWRVDRFGAEARLTHGLRLREADVAEDGGVVAVQVVPGRTRLARLDSGGLSVLADTAAATDWAQPRAGPGALVAATRVRGGWHDVVLLDSSGAVRREVTRDPAVDFLPALSADGAWLFWTSDRTGRAQVYATRAGGADSTWWQVSRAPFGAYAPAPAPDSLFFLSYHSDGFALESAPLDTAAWLRMAPAPAESAAAAPGPLPATIVAEHPYRATGLAVPRYWLPTLEYTVGGGSWVGAFTSGGDPLEKHLYTASASVGSGWRANVSYRYAGISPLLFDASFTHDQNDYFVLGPSGVAQTCCIPSDGAGAGVTLLRQRWRTAAAARLGGEYERRVGFTSGGDRVGVTRAGVVLSASASHTIQPALAVSPQNGWRALLTLRRRWRADAGTSYTERLGRVVAYTSFDAGDFARQVLAVRLAVGVLSGTDSVVYGVGGVSGASYEVAPGLAIGGVGRTFPVRGYAPASLTGRKVASFTIEHRIPLALVGRGWGLAPLLLDRLSASLFLDAGGTASRDNCGTDVGGGECLKLLGAIGTEVVTDLGVGYGFPLRLRLGLAKPLSERGIQGYVVLGSAF